MKERSDVGSSAPLKLVPKIFAKVVKILSPWPITQIVELIAAKFRKVSAALDNFPA